MAENKKSFLLYADLIHTVRKMPKEKAGELLLTILKYVNDENPIVDDMIVDLVFEPIKQQLKRDLKKFEEKKEERSISGQVGNLKRWNNDIYIKYKKGELSLDESLTIANNRIATNGVAKIADNDNDTVNVNDINKREIAFKKEILLFTNFDKKTTDEFFDYWSEPNKSKTKMRFESEKTWDLSRRLKRWSKNDFNGTAKKADLYEINDDIKNNPNRLKFRSDV